MRRKERPKLLFIDDDPVALDMIKSSFEKSEFDILTAKNPLFGLRLLLQYEVSVLISDYILPIINGLELIALTKRIWPDTTCILTSAFEDIRMVRENIDFNLVYRVVAKSWSLKRFTKLVREAVELHEDKTQNAAIASDSGSDMMRKINRQAERAVYSIAHAVDGRGVFTLHHSQNVAAYCAKIGRSLGLDDESLLDLCISALIHDVGKLSIPEEVLLKPGKLSMQEFEAVKKHPSTGASMVKPIHFPTRVADVVLQHHENYDGSGYPRGLGAGEIEDLAKIVRVADAFDGMSMDRSYHQAYSSQVILNWFHNGRGHEFDPDVVDVVVSEVESGRFTADQIVGFPECYLIGYDALQ